MRIEFSVPGDPRGKGRPRFSTYGGRPIAYTDSRTKAYEQLVMKCYMDVPGEHVFPEDAAVFMFITAYFKIPKATPKLKVRLMKQGVIRPLKAPDWDNIGKIICDALNGIAYKDDSRVVYGSVEKFYSDNPRVEVILMDSEVFTQWQDG